MFRTCCTVAMVTCYLKRMTQLWKELETVVTHLKLLFAFYMINVIGSFTKRVAILCSQLIFQLANFAPIGPVLVAAL